MWGQLARLLTGHHGWRQLAQRTRALLETPSPGWTLESSLDWGIVYPPSHTPRDGSAAGFVLCPLVASYAAEITPLLERSTLGGRDPEGRGVSRTVSQNVGRPISFCQGTK